MSTCEKCTQNEAVFKTRGSEYCGDCLKPDMFARFTKAFSAKGSVLPRGEAVCVAWSGGLSSTLLLSYMNSFLNKNLKQNVSPRFSSVIVCVVDYSCLLSEDRRLIVKDDMKKMQSIVESCNFKFLRVPLESAFENETGSLDNSLVADLSSSDMLRLKLQTSKGSVDSVSQTLSLFSSFQTVPATNPTTPITLLHTLTTRLLRRTATSNNCTTLVTGLNASSIASIIVTQTALGGGFNLPNEISREYKVPNSEIITFRPIRDLLFAEVEKLIELDGISHFPAVASMCEGLFGGVVGSVGTEGASVAKMTIQDLAASFVKGLQRDFPHSVSTVSRTAFKIQTGADQDGLDVCLLCSNPIQPRSQNWRASHTTSSLVDIIPGPADSTSEAIVPKSEVSQPSEASPTADSLLCYGCQHVGREAKVRERFVLPGGDWFLGQVKQKKGVFTETSCCSNAGGCVTSCAAPPKPVPVDALRDKIQEFLIDDGDE
ncbi:hypothetical protein BDR26DRAFT_923532 [Obelidium mucronatum]|nr:hypothetical protein BDR26DRAFT_923532 [Obelidium mucronatum]